MKSAVLRGLPILMVTVLIGPVALGQEPTDVVSAPYDRNVPELFTGPPPGDGPVVVYASFHLADINDIDDEAERFEFEAVLRLRWQDPRQAFDPEILGVDERVYAGDFQIAEVFAAWIPGVVLVNESGLYEKQGSVLRIRPDGTATLIETLNAAGETDLTLRRYPYDSQMLDAVFEVLGFNADEVRLEPDPDLPSVSAAKVRIPQWSFVGIEAFGRERSESQAGATGTASSFVVRIAVERESFFMVRLVILPLMLIVMLSWSVFWMDRSSVAERINISFIGILTAVAYQIVVSEIWPNISYFTLMNGFLNLSFMIMCATVIINLVVGRLDRSGNPEAGDRVDRNCRWIFPLTYFGLIAVMLAVAFTLY